MKTIFGIVGFLTMSLTAYSASACDVELARIKSIRAALALEKINGGIPLTTETVSLSSKPASFAVVVGYSGVQRVWVVSFDPELCYIESLKQ